MWESTQRAALGGGDPLGEGELCLGGGRTEIEDCVVADAIELVSGAQRLVHEAGVCLE